MSKPASPRKPRIVLSRTDHDVLLNFAETLERSNPESARFLSDELIRATVVEDAAAPADAVRPGSTVTYRIEDGKSKTIRLVYPANANIDAGDISILSPVGIALLGLRPNQTMPWRDVSGKQRTLLVVAVTNGGEPFVNAGSAK